MSKVLCTFSGKFGDILWSLPTAKEIAKRTGAPVDFAIMPQYKSLLPLLAYQSYIEKAFVIEDWLCTGSPHGDQPWEPPKHCEEGYEKVHHLTYRQHPGIGCIALPLCDFTAWQQGMTLTRPVVPYLETEEIEVHPMPPKPVLCYGFNGDYYDMKQQFLCRLVLRTSDIIAWVDVSQMPWLQAAALIRHNQMYVGCRSACWVIGMAVGAQTITFEPNPNRHADGPWGKIFGCPHAKEWPLSKQDSPQGCAETAVKFVRDWYSQFWEVQRSATAD